MNEPFRCMKASQIYFTTALGMICLVLSITTLMLERYNKKLQVNAQAQQAEIAKGNQYNQVGLNLLKEMAQLAHNGNEKVREVLKANNYTINPPAPEQPAQPAPVQP